jgi:hypothetical protein
MRSMILGVLLLAADVAQAGSTAVFGAGQNSCGRLIATIGKLQPGNLQSMDTASGVFVSEYIRYQEWLMGFVTGFNAAYSNDLEQQVKGTDLAGMDLWMRHWCDKHPTQSVVDGAIAFINEMRSNAAAGQH